MAMYSDDYGETFTKYTQQLKQPLDNPIYQNSNPPQYLWYDNDEITPSEMFIVPSNDLCHYNCTFTDNNTKVLWMSGVNYNSQENIDTGFYMPAYMYPKLFTFDITAGEFSFYDLDVQGLDPADDVMAIGFDLDEDGEVDGYDPNSDPPGEPILAMSCPSWFYNADGEWGDAYFHEANNKIVSNGDKVALVWQDGAKLQAAFYEEEGYNGWVKQPEICISVSIDGGATWSDIRYINANPLDNVIDPVNHYDGNFAPELDGMLPVNISIGDKLEDLGNNHYKLNFVFLDDDDYGSAVGPCVNPGDLTNSALRYAAIDLDFNFSSSDEVTIIADAELLAQNYPNPFNPTTTIAFSMVEAGDVSIEIFNIRGQKVKTLINEYLEFGDHSLIWEGSNDDNQKVSSGIYFYKMKSANYSATKKMILMK